jgi:hypothetical protein
VLHGFGGAVLRDLAAGTALRRRRWARFLPGGGGLLQRSQDPGSCGLGAGDEPVELARQRLAWVGH